MSAVPEQPSLDQDVTVSSDATIDYLVKLQDENIRSMHLELYQELRESNVLPDQDIFLDMLSETVFRVDTDTGTVTDDDMRKFSKLILDADKKVLEQFISHEMFAVKPRSQLQRGDNVVDCIWIRRWKEYGKICKSRL